MAEMTGALPDHMTKLVTEVYGPAEIEEVIATTASSVVGGDYRRYRLRNGGTVFGWMSAGHSQPMVTISMAPPPDA